MLQYVAEGFSVGMWDINIHTLPITCGCVDAESVIVFGVCVGLFLFLSLSEFVRQLVL